MALVTVGVPVFNGADFLENCLACLRDQTYRDIEVLISDNCSEDATGEIARRFCDADQRFRYFRQPENKGPDPNFLWVLEAARTPFFMWRAADDTSDLNYIETLLALLLNHPERDIAVPRAVSVLPNGRVIHVHEVSPSIGKGGEMDRFAQLFGSHCTWFYGLFRKEAMIPIFNEVTVNYPYCLGSDNLMMFPLEFDGKVIGTNTTTFYQYVRYPEPRLSSAERAVRDDEKIERGRSFGAFAHRYVNRRISNPAERWFYHAAVAYFVHKRAYSVSKRLRRRLIRSIGAAARAKV
ncbi:MAG: glycosyltransferase family 2 protein [Rhodomicrobium sp.]